MWDDDLAEARRRCATPVAAVPPPHGDRLYCSKNDIPQWSLLFSRHSFRKWPLAFRVVLPQNKQTPRTIARAP